MCGFFDIRTREPQRYSGLSLAGCITVISARQNETNAGGFTPTFDRQGWIASIGEQLMSLNRIRLPGSGKSPQNELFKDAPDAKRNLAAHKILA